MDAKAQVSCSCGSKAFKYSTPITDDTVYECESCGAQYTHREVMDAAFRKVADNIEDQLLGG